MTVTAAEAYAFEFSANSLRDRMEFYGEDLYTVAYSIFDENLVGRKPENSRLYLTRPADQEPSLFVEMTDDGFDLVFEWLGEEKYRDDIGELFYDDVKKYFN